MATTTTLPAKFEDIKRLQAQMDQMKERLDFISPMLPLVNFVQDYFQKVECEASVQLMRLKNANVNLAKPSSADDEVSNAQLETVKWLHFMTDVVMALHTAQASAPQASSTIGTATNYSRTGSLSVASENSTTSSYSHEVQSMLRRREVDPLAGATSASNRMASPNLDRDRIGRGETLSRANAGETLFPSTSDSRGLAPMQEVSWSRPIHTAEDAVKFTEEVRAHAKAMSGGHISRTSASPVRNINDDPGAPEPFAEPGIGGTAAVASGFEPTLSHSGLVMGKGSWATAYRQASGARRDALRLLCNSGIVTARELSDDLTVISEEHIDECVQIATEMLQTWPIEMWAKQPLEAKKFFEARLTAMYQRKFGEAQKV